jgi:hypothetical protein
MTIYGLRRSRLSAAITVMLLLAIQADSLRAGGSGVFRSRAVGGVNISPEGVVSEPTIEHRETLRREILKDMQPVPEGMRTKVEMRKISLRGLDKAIAHAHEHNMGVLPDEIKYLSGIQRIQYIFVYPDQNDIVLAGPGEGWKVDAHGNVVGETTGLPVLHLDDLIVALRSVHAARTEGISCSIDPTEEGRRNLQSFLGQQRHFQPSIAQGVEQALGMQQVSLTGVPHESRFARMLVAADYRMKRLAMNLQPSPIPGLPSYLHLLKSSAGSMTPRWWLACDYDVIARSDDELTWRLSGQGVKVLTEDETVSVDGEVKQLGRTSVPAKQWADLMTERYEELARAEPVFAELRNLMDLCVVSAIIERHGLRAQAGCELPMLCQADGGAVPATWNTPKAIATQCSFVKRGSNYIITASGGVQIESWNVAAQSEVDVHINALRQHAASATSSWWWN